MSVALPRLVILCGPTGVGKTELTLNIAETIGAEIINADSQSILKGFNIGTAKPTLEEQKQIPHHLLDLVEFGEKFDAACYEKLALQIVQQLLARGKQPLVSGGTGLYIKALIYGLMDVPPRDEVYRTWLEQQKIERGLDFLYQQLQTIDPERAAEIHSHDPYRIMRALELYHLTGKTPSELALAHDKEPRFQALKIGLDRPRDELYQRINQRVLTMMQKGWIEEVEQLLKQGYDLLSRKTQPIGYQLIAQFLRGDRNKKDTIEEIQKQTRQLAKRQLTWFRGDNEIRWYDPTEKKEILKRVVDFIESRSIQS